MVENAKRTTATASRIGNHGATVAKAADVVSTPGALEVSLHVPVMMTASAVMVQITTVSMKGSSSATKPSVAGSPVFTAECAIDAEPTPVSYTHLRAHETDSYL